MQTGSRIYAALTSFRRPFPLGFDLGGCVFMYNLIASAVCRVTLLPVRSLFSSLRSPIER